MIICVFPEKNYKVCGQYNRSFIPTFIILRVFDFIRWIFPLVYSVHNMMHFQCVSKHANSTLKEEQIYTERRDLNGWMKYKPEKKRKLTTSIWNGSYMIYTYANWLIFSVNLN